jgi:hypothetical protein
VYHIIGSVLRGYELVSALHKDRRQNLTKMMRERRSNQERLAKKAEGEGDWRLSKSGKLTNYTTHERERVDS